MHTETYVPLLLQRWIRWGHEYVGVLRLDREELQLARREVLQVPRDDDVRITADRQLALPGCMSRSRLRRVTYGR